MKSQQKYDIESIYRFYYQDVYRYVFHMCNSRAAAEDIVHNTFLRAMTGIGGFRGGSQLKTWLLTIARNESIRYAKKEKNLCSLDAIPEPASNISIADAFCSKESAGLVMRYICDCKEPKKSLLLLHLMDELSFVEIGKILEKSDIWCRVTFMRAKNEIVELLEVSHE